MLFWYFSGLEGKRKEPEPEEELTVEIQGGVFSGSGFHGIVLQAPAGRGWGAQSLDGLEK